LIQRLFREAHTCLKLRHENIIPMLGISTEFDSTLSIISEWMPLRNAHDYILNTENDPRPLVSRGVFFAFALLDIFLRLEGIASGLYYLHSHVLGVVHGDLRGVNALGSDDRRALLTDFGFSTMNNSTFSMAVDPKGGIALRWTAPELLGGGHASMASDVRAFGMTVRELFTPAVPFSNCRSSKGAIARLITGKLPPRPAAEAMQYRPTDAWWEICLSCWGRDPSSRPMMKDIIEKVRVAMVCVLPLH
ncbi:kinase-like domain-containing protein, partial [Pisolithus croceorrhizus]